MSKVKEVLRIYFTEKRSKRSIASITGVPYSTLCGYIALANEKKLDWSEVETMSEELLENTLLASGGQRPLPDWSFTEKELKRKGVTLQLLWQEYKEEHPDGYQYSRFCQLFEQWSKSKDVYTPIPHKAGEELFVDYSGDKMSYVSPETGELVEVEIFVAVLGASGRVYAEASPSQKLPDWIESSINAFEYHGGVTELVIPDNLKSAVTKPGRYEADLNPSYQEFGKHYGTYIIPARVRMPKDKSKVEQGVQDVQRQIIAPLRNRTFFGRDSLNKAIEEQLEKLNNRPFQKMLGSRQGRYEEIDKPALKPLPSTRYVYRQWLVNLPVGPNHLVTVNQHSYSVPCQYARSKVNAVLTRNTIELIFKGKVVARHMRSDNFGETIVREHMPPNYQHYFDSLDREKLLERAKIVGPKTTKWSEAVFALKGRPPKTSCRTVQGVLSLAKEFGSERTEKICSRGLDLNIHSYKRLRSMLVNKVDELPDPDKGSTQSHLPQAHANIRGAESFG